MNIRNFVIIAHIDHGKSTLADRLLEVTGTIPKRSMHAQYLDQLDLEQERGITIKMAPVRMMHAIQEEKYEFNLIDTPGHSDFSYEVSRALAAVEGAILLVDATQGIQAQTLANFRAAQQAGLTIIGAVNKVDLNPSNLQDVVLELAALLNQDPSRIYKVSGKTGQGVLELLEAVAQYVPAPSPVQTIDMSLSRALIFDSFYDDHKGVVASVRVFNGTFRGHDIYLVAPKTHTKVKEIGYFTPKLTPSSVLYEGEIGYIATGIKDPERIRIGDTILEHHLNITDYHPFALSGYQEPKPVVFVSFYPEESEDHELLYRSLQRLRLNDSSISIEPDQNEVLGRGFKVGFLGRLHFEIIAERLRREFNMHTVNTFPSVLYQVRKGSEWASIVKPEDLPPEYDEILEPTVLISLLMPSWALNSLFQIQHRFRMTDMQTHILTDIGTQEERIRVTARMPLSELISDFDDQLKSVTQGYASFSYEMSEYVKARIVKIDVLVSHKLLPGLSRFFPAETAEREGRLMIERLKKLLPRQQFVQPIQAQANNKIIAREDIPALRKDVTGYLYGGDRTRKMKLWKKQKRGKEKLKSRASDVKIQPDIFKELLKK